MAQRFVVVHEWENVDSGKEYDVVGVSDTLEGARVWGQKRIRHLFGQDIFFNSVGWGTLRTDTFTDADGGDHVFEIHATLHVSQRTRGDDF